MSRAKTLPRFIRPYDVEEGDTVKVAWNNLGVEHTRTATIDRIIEDGNVQSFHTKEGAEVFHYIPPQDKLVRVTLLAVKTENQTETPLFEMENN